MGDSVRLEFACESLNQVRSEITPLLDLHYAEVGQKDLTLSPDWTRFAHLEVAGVLAAFTVRSGGRLIGYAVFFVQPHIHYSGSIVAINDVIFIHPGFRQGTAGLRLIKHAETGLRVRGVEKIYYHSKIGTPLERLLNACGYDLMENIMARKIA